MDYKSMTSAELAEVIAAALRELMHRAGPDFPEAWEAAEGDFAAELIREMQDRLMIEIL